MFKIIKGKTRKKLQAVRTEIKKSEKNLWLSYKSTIKQIENTRSKLWKEIKTIKEWVRAIITTLIVAQVIEWINQ